MCVPVPEADALPATSRGRPSSAPSPRPTAAGVAGPELTPWLLARIAVLTDGASIRANTALIVNDARVRRRSWRCVSRRPAETVVRPARAVLLPR